MGRRNLCARITKGTKNMACELIRDFGGRIIARIETMPNGDKVVRDFAGKILGKYDKRFNVTRNFSGMIVARGECLGLLIGR